MIFDKTPDLVVNKSMLRSPSGRQRIRDACLAAKVDLQQGMTIRMFACDAGNDILLLLEAVDEIERMQAIIDRIPKTADGHPTLPGDVVWHVRKTVYSGVVVSLDNDGHIETTAHGDAPDACYHHYAAARAALEKNL